MLKKIFSWPFACAALLNLNCSLAGSYLATLPYLQGDWCLSDRPLVRDGDASWSPGPGLQPAGNWPDCQQVPASRNHPAGL